MRGGGVVFLFVLPLQIRLRRNQPTSVCSGCGLTFPSPRSAFLFSHAMNVEVGPKEDRQLMTGLHTVADIYSYEESQKYKEGKFILEKSKIMKENW
ncbi:unnamed protein product [Spirodela intermedia]|uniref:Yippee domain-containing protein n=1 Tax=Spirodela intermedia TaxID=51605 RepID=A0A7I8JW17_SPIIN|nr:unnamed protein product [Spirodela intermedia]CAA6673652.1 unnamed protein product [Spirodela intermedia]